MALVENHTPSAQRSLAEAPHVAAPSPVVELAVKDLRPGTSPRVDGLNLAHVRVLTELRGAWPPLLVTRGELRVVDGHHRLEAAKLLGVSSVSCTWFDGGPAAAFLESVRRNTAHGLPLTLRERKHAASTIAERWSDWSDRRIARLCGVSPGTVSKLRVVAPDVAADPSTTTRVGVDGRRRPVAAGAVRERALQALSASPNASARQIARSIGASPSTVAATRRELQRHVPPTDSGARPPLRAVHSDGETWVRDVALTTRAEADAFVAWFSRTDPGSEWEPHAAAVPVSRIYEIADEARHRAGEWARFATYLERSVVLRTGARRQPG